jgi:hypothetical protein
MEQKVTWTLLLAQNACQSPQHISNTNSLCTGSCFRVTIPLVQPLTRCAEDAICHALSCATVLFDLMHAVREEVDVWFQGLAEMRKVRL